MSIVTKKVSRHNNIRFVKSQLPFGFDVDCYTAAVRGCRSANTGSQLPFGFDVDCYTKIAKITSDGSFVLSQLPFGFDVDCYQG